MNKDKVTQKDLFNKTAVTKVKEILNSSIRVVYIYGPVGCGKTTTVEVLCKNYDILKIDPDHLRRADLMEKIIKDLNNISGNMSWTEILSKGKKTEKKKIVLIDGIDLCEKTICSFLDKITEVKIILISTECIRAVSNLPIVCPVAFNKPSLLELCKLIEKESNDSELKKDPKMMEELVIRAEFDTRQVLNLIQNRCPSNVSKIRDYDLEEKTLMLFSDNYSFNKSFLLGSSEPSILTNSVFNNYLNCKNRNYIEETTVDTLSSLDNVSKGIDNLKLESDIDINLTTVIDSISMADALGGRQLDCWETNSVVTTFGCVIPSYHLDSLSKVNYSNQAPSTVCSLRSKEEIILANWIKWGAFQKFVDWIKEKRLYKINDKGKIDFFFPKGIKVKLTKVQRSKIIELLEKSLTAKSSSSSSSTSTIVKETEVNLQWFKTTS